jgi:hypothetical protein
MDCEKCGFIEPDWHDEVFLTCDCSENKIKNIDKAMKRIDEILKQGLFSQIIDSVENKLSNILDAKK